MEGNTPTGMHSFCPSLLRSSKLPPQTWARKARREGGEPESWGVCQLQPEGADGAAALGLEKSCEWEALRESSGIDNGWERGGEEGKEGFFATVYKHQDLQSIRRSSCLLGNRVMHGHSTIEHRPQVSGNFLQG